jgi:hypothetical protein
MRKYNKTILVFLLILLFGCEDKDESVIKEMIDQRIEKRLNEYITIEKQRCKTRLLEEASVIADSLLRANPVMIQLDSLQRPPVPIKPTKPTFERRTDSVKIAPIIPIKE